MRLSDLTETGNLEEYRQHVLDVLQVEQGRLKQIAEDVLQEQDVIVKPIGSVLDPQRFNENSDIDVGFYLTPQAARINERLSEKLQQALIKYPLGDIGVVNAIVFE